VGRRGEARRLHRALRRRPRALTGALGAEQAGERRAVRHADPGLPQQHR
jgi:hypothetical protein